MPMLIEPPDPTPFHDEDDDMARYRLRLVQVTAAAATVSATAWCCTLGVFPAILALLVAKHVLVAVLLMGLGADGR